MLFITKTNFRKRKIIYAAIFLAVSLLLSAAIFFTLFVHQRDILLPEEREWLDLHRGKVRLAVYPDYPPIEFYNENREYAGVTADYIRILEETLNFKFEFVFFMDWDLLIKKAKAKEIDVISNISHTPQRDDYLLFTEPYVDAHNVIIVRNDDNSNLSMKDLNAKKVVVVKSFAMHDVMLKEYPAYNFYAAADTLAALTDVSFGRADAAVLELPISSYQIKKSGLTNLRVAGITPYRESMGLAVRRDWPVLNRIINKGLAEISRTERERIYQKWIHLSEAPFYRSRLFIFIITGSVFFVLFIFIFFSAINRALKRQVSQRTEELHNELIRRKDAETALVKKMEEQALLLDNINTQVWYLVDPRTCGAVNRAFAGFSGYSQEALQGKNFDTILAPEDVNKFIEDNAAVFSSGRQSMSEEWIKNSKGEKRLLKITKTPKLDSKCLVEYVVCAADDITDMRS